MALLRYVYELWINGAWVDITTYVRHTQGVKLQRGTTDGSRKLTPSKATLTLDNTDGRFNPDNPQGPYFGHLVRNTPLRISCAGGVSDAVRGVLEVYSFRPRWTKDHSNVTVPITANGALRRIIERELDPQSYYLGWLTTRTTNPKPRYVWPLNEGVDAGGAQPAIGSGTGITKTPFPDGAGWGKARMNDWLPNGVALDNLNEMTFPADMRGASGSAWEMSVLISTDNVDGLSTGVVECGTVRYFWALASDTVTDPDNPTTGVTVYAFAANGDLLGFTGLTSIAAPIQELGPIWLTIRSSWNGTTTFTYAAWWPVARSDNPTVWTVVSRPTANLEWPRQVMVAATIDLVDRDARGYVGYSCLSVSECSSGTAGMLLSYTATKGAPGEWTYDRFLRLCAQFGINASASVNGAVQMGRQYLQGFEDHLEEIVASSVHQGIVESRTANQLTLLGEGTYRGDIDYSECIGDLEPVSDDQGVANIITVNQSHGPSTTTRKATGRMSVAAIGPFTGKLNTNTRTYSQALALGGRLLAMGTWEGPRFTSVTVSARANPSQYAKYRTIDVGDFFGLANLDPAGYYDILWCRVTHVEESLRHEDHTFTFTITPADVDALQWRLGTDSIDITDSTVAVAAAPGASTVDVHVPTAKWAIGAAPFYTMIAGETCQVTAVANLTATTQRLTVNRSGNGVSKTLPVGAEVHTYSAFHIRAV